MQIRLLAQHINLNKTQEDRVREKIGKLAKFADPISSEASEIKIEISFEDSKNPEQAYNCILTLFVPHDVLRAESRKESLDSSVDEVIEKIKSQIEYYKAKVYHLNDRK
jgi:ribosomal subunit interface protein